MAYSHDHFDGYVHSSLLYRILDLWRILENQHKPVNPRPNLRTQISHLITVYLILPLSLSFPTMTKCHLHHSFYLPPKLPVCPEL